MDFCEPVKLLLVEDNRGDQKLFETSLRLQKVSNSLSIASSGEEAIEYLEQTLASPSVAKRPDIIILDLNMPGIGGKEFLRRIKRDERFRSIPVIVLTTSDSEVDIKECYDLQIAGYIKKPVNLDGFLNIIKTIEQYWFNVCKLHSRVQ